ncbi:MAG: DUF488 domain-containing protein [Deltaproteobacteria bacterium]|nr:DUF488 domain-containing protein [Deltaproteobacteria bacterium]
MEIHTIGFTKTTARGFFGRLRNAGIRRLIDVRLHNTSQLAGFAKADDLAYFLEAILAIEYVHEPRLAPSDELLNGLKKAKSIGWREFERGFLRLMDERRAAETLDRNLFASRSALLCSEATAEHCHRRLVAEHLAARWPDEDIRIVHL